MKSLVSLLLSAPLILTSCKSSNYFQNPAFQPPTISTQVSSQKIISDYKLPENVFYAMNESYTLVANKCDDLAQQARDVLALKGVSLSNMRMPIALRKKDHIGRHMWLEQLLPDSNGKTASWYIVDPTYGEGFYYVPLSKHLEEYDIEKILPGNAIYIDEFLPEGKIVSEETVGYMHRNQFKKDWLKMIEDSKKIEIAPWR